MSSAEKFDASESDASSEMCVRGWSVWVGSPLAHQRNCSALPGSNNPGEANGGRTPCGRHFHPLGPPARGREVGRPGDQSSTSGLNRFTRRTKLTAMTTEPMRYK